MQFKFVSNNLLIRTLSLLQFYILPFVAGGTIFSNLKCIVWMYNVHLYNFNYQLKKKNLTSPPHTLPPSSPKPTPSYPIQTTPLPKENLKSSNNSPYTHTPQKRGKIIVLDPNINRGLILYLCIICNLMKLSH